MSSIREYTQKIASLKGMGRITKTMKMVAAGYYRRSQDLLRAAIEYNQHCEHLSRIAESLCPGVPPVVKNTSTATHLLIISSNRGLCGSYNAAIARLVHKFAREKNLAPNELSVSYAGSKALTLLHNSFPPVENFELNAELPTPDECLGMAMRIYTRFRQNQFGNLYIAYTKSKNALASEPLIQQLVPFAPLPDDSSANTHQSPPTNQHSANSNQQFPDPLMLPDPVAVRDLLRAQTIISRLYLARAHAATAEHAARRASMDNASANINKLTDHYIQLRNTARQANITRELTEIVSGAESLNNP